ncbi:MAG: hypothetical protein NUV82_00740 [Candidatus Komeilibacteria bacterium]|nr:hypothetical protein [Candidatus Komeilibacteria bacterium]
MVISLIIIIVRSTTNGVRMKIDKDKARKVAEILDLSLAKVIKSLGNSNAVVANIFTIRQAQRAFLATELNSEEEHLIMERWILLCTTRRQVEKAFRSAAENSGAQRLAMDKWLSLCTTIRQLARAFEATEPDSKAERMATQRWLRLCDTIKKARDFFVATATDSEAEVLALRKWLSLCTTPKQVQKVRERALSYSEPVDSKLEAQVVRRLYELV